MHSGGWPKNQRWLEGPNQEYMRQCRETGVGSTIDNGATTSEMRVLANSYKKYGDKRYRESFIKGLKYLLEMQYDNGGWPQFYPARAAAPYSAHITFNDNAMIGVMRMIRDIGEGKGVYGEMHISKSLRKKALTAFDKGVKCILNCQIQKNGKLTVWCQQHDENTLMPAKARAYELPSYTAHGESVEIVRLLSEIKNPSDRVKAAIEGAIQWMKDHAIVDMVLETYVNDEGKTDKRLVHKVGAPLLWARYYDLENEEPMFCDRDGIPKKHIEDIGYERRNGYSWLGDSPKKIINIKVK